MSEIVLHHLENSRSFRLVWMLEELGLDYRIQEYKRDPRSSRAPPELKQLHPLGKAPVLAIDGRVLAESGAILEYLVEREGRLRPTETEALLQYRYWLHFAEGTLMPPLLVKLIMDKLRAAPLPFFLKPIVRGIADKVGESYYGPEIELDFGFVEQHLAQSDYFAGAEFSAADVQMLYGVDAGMARAGLGAKPAIRAWLDRMEARPAYQRAIERGGRNEIP